ncbi:MAG: hypothetical protein ACYDAQ_02500, partial [Mycobacteriales bacterium]
MKSLTMPGLGLALVLGLASGCGGGSPSPAAATPAASPTASASRSPRNFGAVGEITKVSGSTLTVQSARASRTVILSASTRILRVQAGTIADIATGDCVVAAGSTNSIGTVTASSLSLTPAGPNGCTARRFGGGLRGGLRFGSASPRPGGFVGGGFRGP